MRPAAACLRSALLSTIWCFGCQEAEESLLEKNPADRRLQTTKDGPSSPVRFVEWTSEAGIDFVHANGATDERVLIETMGSGAAWFDLEGDGDPDLYLVQSGSWRGERSPGSGGRLYLNDGSGRFTDVTEARGLTDPGYGMGAAAADIDSDGDVDLFVTCFGPDVLYRNRGDGTFEDVTAESGLGESGWSTSCAFFDYDRDGHLDLFVVHYLAMSITSHRRCFFGEHHVYCSPDEYDGEPDRLYRNRGDGTFEDVSARVGLRMDTRGKGLGVVVSDLDHDGWPDVYVANDRTPNFLYHSLGDGRFEEIGELAGVAREEGGRSESGMGVDAGDFDGDGDFDLVVTNYQNETNTLYRAKDGLYFIDVTTPTCLTSATFYALGFGTDFFDADNDGWLDLWFTNGHVLDNAEVIDTRARFAQQDCFLWNRPGRAEGQRLFRNITESAGPGLALAAVSRGLATADIDGDGDIDVLVTNNGSRPFLLRNHGGDANAWIALEPWLPEKRRLAIGARVTIEAGGRDQVEELRAGSSYLCQNQPRLHFGLGRAESVNRVVVEWPDGTRSEYRDLPMRQVVRLLPDGRWEALRR